MYFVENAERCKHFSKAQLDEIRYRIFYKAVFERHIAAVILTCAAMFPCDVRGSSYPVVYLDVEDQVEEVRIERKIWIAKPVFCISQLFFDSKLVYPFSVIMSPSMAVAGT